VLAAGDATLDEVLTAGEALDDVGLTYVEEVLAAADGDEDGVVLTCNTELVVVREVVVALTGVEVVVE